MILVLLLSILSAILAIRLYYTAGESCSLCILAFLGIVYTDIGLIVSPSIILYFCTRHLLL